MRQTFAPNEKKSGQMKFFCAFGAGQREPWELCTMRQVRGQALSLGSAIVVIVASRDFICLFDLWFYVPVNNYGHVKTVS